MALWRSRVRIPSAPPNLRNKLVPGPSESDSGYLNPMTQEFYPFKEIDKKWQDRWEKEGLFKMDPSSPKEKYYCLMMFPYPSSALHVGHGRNYIIGDVVARYKIMRKFNVLSPMGWDAFGLPAENAAIKGGVHPGISTLNNIKTMKKQLRSWGTGYDWDREVTSCLPDYYLSLIHI